MMMRCIHLCDLAMLAPAPCIWSVVLLIHGEASCTGVMLVLVPRFVGGIQYQASFVVLHCMVKGAPLQQAEL